MEAEKDVVYLRALCLSACGLDNAEIARRLDVHIDQVQQALQFFKSTYQREVEIGRAYAELEIMIAAFTAADNALSVLQWDEG